MYYKGVFRKTYDHFVINKYFIYRPVFPNGRFVNPQTISGIPEFLVFVVIRIRRNWFDSTRKKAMGVIHMSENEGFLPRIEWEWLEQEYEIRENVSAKFLRGTSNNVIKLWRDENYKIAGVISGFLSDKQKGIDLEEGKAGEKVVPYEIVGTNTNGFEKYKLSHCYLGNISYGWAPQTSDDYVKKYEAKLVTFHVERFYDFSEKTAWLTEWYLNGPRRSFWYLRPTERKFSETYERNRNVYRKKTNKFPGTRIEGATRDYLFIKLPEYSFIIHKVPKPFGPSWSENIGIEYRDEFGKIPDKAQREAISEIVGFVFGKQLMNVGYTVFNESGSPLKQVYINPWWNNAKVICDSHERSPMFKCTYQEMGQAEQVLEQLIPSYLTLRNELNLNEVLWRYWMADSMPLGTNLPMFANGVEILSNCWFKSKQSKTQGVYLPKKEFDSLLKREFSLIESKVKNLQYGNRILNRMKSAFQLGANEKLQFFFDEIGVQPGEIEKKAIRIRNVMIHSSVGNSDEQLQKMMKLTSAYKTFFHRVFLKILGYEGTYVDYSTLDWPKRSLNELAGG